MLKNIRRSISDRRISSPLALPTPLSGLFICHIDTGGSRLLPTGYCSGEKNLLFVSATLYLLHLNSFSRMLSEFMPDSMESTLWKRMQRQNCSRSVWTDVYTGKIWLIISCQIHLSNWSHTIYNLDTHSLQYLLLIIPFSGSLMTRRMTNTASGRNRSQQREPQSELTLVLPSQQICLQHQHQHQRLGGQLQHLLH